MDSAQVESNDVRYWTIVEYITDIVVEGEASVVFSDASLCRRLSRQQRLTTPDIEAVDRGRIASNACETRSLPPSSRLKREDHCFCG